ncbi:MAG: HAD family hydrolase [Muribaculaceae bacterium]|nr:HAD family hydrolase [Muribaculaceae bacterium]
MNIKGIIFDYGGTLDTGGDHWSHVIRDGWNKAGIAANDALFREAYVYGEQELERVEHILPHHNFADVLDIKMQIELQFLAQTGNFPPALVEEKAKEIAAYCYGMAKEEVTHSKTVLEELSKKYPLVLVSNFYGNIESVLKDFGIFDCFKKVIESAKVGVRKPDTKIFELGIKALELKPEEVLVVGDSLKNDINPAKKLGCHTLLLEGKGWDDTTPLQHDGESIRKLDEILSFLGNA